MNVYTEMTLRLIGLFSAVYFTTKWTVDSTPKFDTILSYIIVAIALASIQS